MESEQSDPVVDQIVDIELSERSGVEIYGAYQSICAMLMLRTAMVVGRKTPPRKEEIDQRQVAVQWLEGGHGVLSFEGVCEALDIDPDRARDAIQKYAAPGGGDAINRKRRKPHSHMVFGKANRHAERTVFDRRENPSANRMGPGTSDGARNCERQAG